MWLFVLIVAIKSAIKCQQSTFRYTRSLKYKRSPYVWVNAKISRSLSINSILQIFHNNIAYYFHPKFVQNNVILYCIVFDIYIKNTVHKIEKYNYKTTYHILKYSSAILYGSHTKNNCMVGFQIRKTHACVYQILSFLSGLILFTKLLTYIGIVYI